MASTGIGERLQNARTARGLSLDDIEAATRIKRHYLDAIEREAWDELPAPAYARAFLAAYARQLGIPPDEALSHYSSGGTPSGAVPHPVEVRITPGATPSRLRRIMTAIVAALIAIALIVTWVLVGQLRQFAATRPRPGGTANPSLPPSASTPAGPSAATPISPSSTSAPGGQPGGAAPTQPGPVAPGTIVIAAQATDRSWVRVVSDGSVVFEGFVSAGDHQTWQGRQVSIRVGNASALDLSVNGKPIGRLGNPGDVVDRTFTATNPGGTTTPAGAPAAAPSAPPAAAPVAPPAPPAAAPAAPRAPGTAPASPGPPTGIPVKPPSGDHQ
jgi:cytoskeleton protein RodZ